MAYDLNIVGGVEMGYNCVYPITLYNRKHGFAKPQHHSYEHARGEVGKNRFLPCCNG